MCVFREPDVIATDFFDQAFNAWHWFITKDFEFIIYVPRNRNSSNEFQSSTQVFVVHSTWASLPLRVCKCIWLPTLSTLLKATVTEWKVQTFSVVFLIFIWKPVQFLPNYTQSQAGSGLQIHSYSVSIRICAIRIEYVRIRAHTQLSLSTLKRFL